MVCVQCTVQRVTDNGVCTVHSETVIGVYPVKCETVIGVCTLYSAERDS